jgi:hypothetical protein
MKEDEIISKANKSPALNMQHSAQYPKRYNGRVPLKIKCLKTVLTDAWFMGHDKVVCEGQKEYHVWVNAYGYTHAILPSGKLIQLKPDEYEVIEWHKTKK